MNVALRKLNSAAFRYMEQRWRVHPRFRISDPDVPIDRPIFLLGIGGGGLTLTARILKRTRGVVSATGNHHYWAGNDEMQNVLQDFLHESFSWRNLDVPGFLPRHDNTYGCDALFGYYHEVANDLTSEKRESFRSALQRTIALNRDRRCHPTPRFIDKSQTYTLRTRLIAGALDDTRPKFVLITRDPFAICWRGVLKAKTLCDLDKTDQEKMVVSVQHWRNNMREALEARSDVDLRWWRFEDLLASPERVIREICEFVELPFSPDILPGPDDRIPWGSSSDAFDRYKWYPLRADVSKSWLEKIPGWAIELVEEECSELLQRFGDASPAR